MSNILITGITGQVGSNMAEKCLQDGHRVIGLIRRSSSVNTSRISGLLANPNLELVEGDGTDSGFINHLISTLKPDIVYNYMAQSHVATSFGQPSYTLEITGKSVLYLLEAIKNFSPNTRLIHASSSEQFGDQYDIDENGKKYQDENTKMNIKSPYANAKLMAYNYIRLYRTSYNLFATNIIMFNAESPNRGDNFVTKKITKWIGQYKKYLNTIEATRHNNLCDPEQSFDGNFIVHKWTAKVLADFPKLRLGNLDSYRDWGFVGDYITAYIMAANHTNSDDFVICTGETHSIREFLEEAFSCAQLGNYKNYVVQDPQFMRPAEVDYLCGKADKAKRILGWEPKTKFKELVRLMVDYDVKTQASQKN